MDDDWPAARTCLISARWSAAASVVAAMLVGAVPLLAEDRALVVGIGDYQALAPGVSLPGAVADAERFARFLQDSQGFGPEQVTLLLDTAATGDAILGTISSELTGQTRRGDRVVLYFAGMGARLGDGSRVLLAHDSGSVLEGLSEDLVADLLDLVPDRAITVVIDASFDGLERPGLGLATRGLPSEGPWSPAEPPFGQGVEPRMVWNAAGPGQPAWEEQGQGVFTRAFLEAQVTGPVSGPILLERVTRETEAWCDRTPACAATGRGLRPAFAAGPRTVDAPPAEPARPELDGWSGVEAFLEDLLGPDSGRLRLKLDSGATIRIGDTVTLEVTADQPGYLTLMDWQAETGLAILAEGVALGESSAPRFAAQFRAAEPTGPGALIAVLVAAQEGDMPLPDLKPADPEGSLRGLVEDLRRMESEERLDWAAARFAYEVVR